MKPKVYPKTGIISYLAARPSRDLAVEANRILTHEWWDLKRSQYEIFVSDFVYDEAIKGDENAAKRRILILNSLTSLKMSEEAMRLSHNIMQLGILPKNAEEDSVHIAIAISNGMNFLLTWNCKHLSNVTFQQNLAKILTDRGFVVPLICTPRKFFGE